MKERRPGAMHFRELERELEARGFWLERAPEGSHRLYTNGTTRITLVRRSGGGATFGPPLVKAILKLADVKE